MGNVLETEKTQPKSARQEAWARQRRLGLGTGGTGCALDEGTGSTEVLR